MRILTCWLMLLSASIGFAQSADEKTATLAYLKSLHQSDGGFIGAAQDPSLDQAPRSSLRATSAAIRAFKYFGGELPDKKKTAAFVLSCYDAKSGAFSDQPGGKPDVIVTAVGMMAAAEVVADFDFTPATKYLLAHAKTFEERRLAIAGMEANHKFPPDIDAWIDDVKKTATPAGTFGSNTALARATGSAVAMILRTGKDLPPEQRTTIIKALQEAQRADGAYGGADRTTSDLETTYRIMRAFHLLKANPKDTQALRTFIAKCRNSDGGYGVEPGKPSAVNSTYYAAIILNWLPK